MGDNLLIRRLENRTDWDPLHISARVVGGHFLRIDTALEPMPKEDATTGAFHLRDVRWPQSRQWQGSNKSSFPF